MGSSSRELIKSATSCHFNQIFLSLSPIFISHSTFKVANYHLRLVSSSRNYFNNSSCGFLLFVVAWKKDWKPCKNWNIFKRLIIILCFEKRKNFSPLTFFYVRRLASNANDQDFLVFREKRKLFGSCSIKKFLGEFLVLLRIRNALPSCCAQEISVLLCILIVDYARSVWTHVVGLKPETAKNQNRHENDIKSLKLHAATANW